MMRPDIHTPARALTRTECAMQEFMVGLAGAGRLDDAQACRDELRAVSERRSQVAAIELARAERDTA